MDSDNSIHCQLTLKFIQQRTFPTNSQLFKISFLHDDPCFVTQAIGGRSIIEAKNRSSTSFWPNLNFWLSWHFLPAPFSPSIQTHNLLNQSIRSTNRTDFSHLASLQFLLRFISKYAMEWNGMEWNGMGKRSQETK
jgi:hypothetical protein